MLFQNYLIPEIATEITTHTNMKQTLKSLLTSDLDFDKKIETIPQHSWHPFPARFPPALPHKFIQALTKEGDLILDPMSGSCTTLLESVRLNRNAVGFDIDPLSLVL